MAYTMVIVDDEYFNRVQLMTMIDWKSIGFNVLSGFSSYEDAIRFLECNPVDVLFTDIRLGNYSGIDLAKRCRELYPEIEIVLISAYTEFDYAREAITIDVFEYLLKPVLPDTISDCFGRLCEKLDEKHLLKDEHREYEYLVAQSFYNDVFSGMITSAKEAECLANESKIDLWLGKRIYLLLCLTDEELQFKNRPFYGGDSMTALIRQFNEKSGYSDVIFAIALEEQQLFILAAVDTDELDEAGIEGFISRLTQDFLRICGFPVHCVLWDKDTDVLKLAARFRDNRNAALDYKYAFSKVKEYIKSGEAASALHVVKNIAEQRQLKGQDLYRFACDVIDILKENEFPSGSLIDEFHVKARGVSDEKLLSLLGELFKHLSDEMSALTYNEYYITYAQKYISENLCENISLEKVAESVALSPAYFSRYFREITGSRFIDYLCQVRVDKAKELLLSPEVKVSDIHELVGYHSRSRFYALFQEKTGLTPHEYRRQHLNRI